MLGGHLDSWHSATGATDNAIGCAVMMEAARILKAIGVQPRRTIRVALWSGEEQGLLGSQAYVKEHFGIVRGAEARVREARRLLEHRLRHRPRARRGRLRPAGGGRRHPRAPQAVRGHRRHRRVGDEQPRHRRHRLARRSTTPACPASASARIRSSTTAHTWHTNLDTYERIIEEDAKKSAMTIASVRLSPRDARRDAAALPDGRDAAAAGRPRRRPRRPLTPGGKRPRLPTSARQCAGLTA